MRSVCFVSILIVIQWFEACQSEETTLGNDIDSLSPYRNSPKLHIVLLPPVFSVIGVTLIVISVLTTIFCIAYCIFLPWAHALSNKPVVQEVTTTASPSSASAASALNQQPLYAGAIPPHPYYTGGGNPYFPNQPYPYYAAPQPPTTESSTGTTTTGTTTTTKPEPSTSPTPDEQNIKEIEEFIIENI